MTNFTLDTFATHLTRTFVPRCPQDCRPSAVMDTDEKGRTVLDFTLPNPHDLRHSVSLRASGYKGSVTLCTLWFGQAEVTAALDAEDAVPAITEIIDGHIVAIVRYKNRDAFDDRRKGSGKPGAGQAEWLYQLPEDEAALAAMQDKLRTPAGLWNKLSGTLTGVFEVYNWERSEVMER